MRATTVPRARQSAEGFIAGFFNNTRTPAPPLIPITTVPTNLDVLQAVRNRCPALDKIKDDLVASSGWQQHLAQASSLKQQLDGICGTGGQAGWAVSYDHFFDKYGSCLSVISHIPIIILHHHHHHYWSQWACHGIHLISNSMAYDMRYVMK